MQNNDPNSYLFPKNPQPIKWDGQPLPDEDNVDLKRKTCMVVDNGLFGPSLAIKLTKDFKQVYLCIPFDEEFKSTETACIGMGLPGVFRVKDIDEVEVDLYIFCNSAQEETQKRLIKEGKRVWGSRLASDLEQNRLYGAKTVQKLGLLVPNILNIKGIDNLIKYLTPLENKFIKTSYWRGAPGGETWHYTNMKECALFLDNIKNKLGVIGSIFEYLVYDPIEAEVEAGADYIVINGKPSNYCQYGIEIKDLGYVCEMIPYTSLPTPVKAIHDKLNTALGNYNYRNLFSTEIRVHDKGMLYFTDWTCRFGRPSFDLFINNVSNISKVFWFGANGTLIDLEIQYKYCVSANIISEFAEQNYQAIYYPDAIKDYVVISNLMVLNGVSYSVPTWIQYGEVGSVIGFSNESFEDAVAQCQQHTNQVHGFGLEIRTDAIPEAMEQIKKCDNLGLSFI